jgi:hypothetical protein
MRTFDLELRVATYGSIITWHVLLEDSTNPSMRVQHWSDSGQGYFFKLLPGYQVKDTSLEVFAGCNGIAGGKVECVAIINGTARPQKVTAKVADRVYATESYPV